MSNLSKRVEFRTNNKISNASGKLRSKGFTHQEIYLAGLEIINTMIDPKTKPSETKKIADMLTKKTAKNKYSKGGELPAGVYGI